MNELITRCLSDKAVNMLAEFPVELLQDSEKELIDFAVEYDTEYAAPPSLGRVMEEHSWFLPFRFEPTRLVPEPPPIMDVFEQTLKERLLSVTESKLRAARNSLEVDEEIPLEILGEIIKLNALSTGVFKFSTFDRSSYHTTESITLPFRIINGHIGGLSRGDFMLICGRLGSGKSTVAQFISKVLWQEGKKVLFISAEMLPADVFGRIDAMIGKFNPKDLRSRDEGVATRMDSLLRGVAKKARAGVGEIIIPKSRLMTPSQIGAFAKNLDVDVIVVDGTYLLRPTVGGATAKWEKVAAVSNELKQMALDLNTPLIGTTQLKRGAGESGSFTAEDLSYSDALGQDADFLLMVNPSKVVKGTTDLELAKNRYGGLCATRIETDFDTMTITETVRDISKDEEDWGAAKVAVESTPVIEIELPIKSKAEALKKYAEKFVKTDTKEVEVVKDEYEDWGIE